MAFITNQWLKHSFQDRGHYPIKVDVKSHKEQSDWDKDHGIVATLIFDKKDEYQYQCSKCGVTTIRYGFSTGLPTCSNCDKQLERLELKKQDKYSEYQQAYLTQEDIGSIIEDLFLTNSVESNREFLRKIIPNISDDFKFELVKLLLKDEY